MQGAPWISVDGSPPFEAFTWVEQEDPALVLQHPRGHLRVTPVSFDWYNALREVFKAETGNGTQLLAAATSRWGPMTGIPDTYNNSGFATGVEVTAQRMLFAADTHRLLNNSPLAVETVVAGSCALAAQFRKGVSSGRAKNAVGRDFNVDNIDDGVATITECVATPTLETIGRLDSNNNVTALPAVSEMDT